MSMPHECKCGICGHPLWGSPLGQLPTLEDRQSSELLAKVSRAAGARDLASAIHKIAPELAEALAKRWEEIQRNERDALDEFLTFLRSPPQHREPHADQA
jgi:hypothetical protein